MFNKDVDIIKDNIINYLKNNYKNGNFKKENLILLNMGKFANATVFEYKDENYTLTIKDFSGSPWLVKKTFGKLFINSEFNNLIKLKSNPSIAKNAKKISEHTLSFDFIEGKSLKSFENNSIGREFFLELEKNVRDMHSKNIVHLDLRNLGNIIVGSDNYPYIIDFQSAISTKFLFPWLERTLKVSDLTGVYKCWNRKCTDSLDDRRTNILNNFNKIRKVWIFRGYPISRAIKKLKSSTILKLKSE